MVASVLIIFFIMRAEIFGRVREIGLMRAIGVKRSEIAGIFACEALVISLLASGIGVLISSLACNFIQSISALSGQGVITPLWVYLLCAVVLVGISVLFGILPAVLIMRKTPAEILAKYDI